MKAPGTGARKAVKAASGRPAARPGRTDCRTVDAARVGRARKEAAPTDEVERLSLIYQALADPTRLRLALALAGGEMCVCDLAAALDAGESAVSHQLRLLRHLALVRKRRAGRVIYYALDDRHVEQLIEVGLDHVREERQGGG